VKRRRLECAAIASLGLALASCAPHLIRPPSLDRDDRRSRYFEREADRIARATAVEAQAVLWVELDRGNLPGAQARLVLASPDAFRVRVQSMFGTFIDLGGRGDSLTAYLPPRRVGMAIDATADSLGVREPGALFFRALSATWRPPAEAWAGATWRDSLLALRWLDQGDTLEIAVGSDGLPAWASLARPDGFIGRVRYRGYDQGSGLAWPNWIELEDSRGGFRVTCKLQNLQFRGHSDPARLLVALPGDAERLTIPELKRAIRRSGVF
jgi:hypothetical protein